MEQKIQIKKKNGKEIKNYCKIVKEYLKKIRRSIFEKR